MKCSGEYENQITSSYIMARISKFHKPFLSEKIYCLEVERVTSNILFKICAFWGIIVTHDCSKIYTPEK